MHLPSGAGLIQDVAGALYIAEALYWDALRRSVVSVPVGKAPDGS